MKSVLITGPIGSGKSVVSKILLAMGYPVYDCDSRAKQLIDTDSKITEEIERTFGCEVFHPDGSIDRKRLASIVFNDSRKLSRLNNIIHSAVRTDIDRWLCEQSKSHGIAFVETAIPVTARLDEMVDKSWIVTAPEVTRRLRVVSYRGMTESDFNARNVSQKKELPDGDCSYIHNDGLRPVLPQIENLLAEL